MKNLKIFHRFSWVGYNRELSSHIVLSAEMEPIAILGILLLRMHRSARLDIAQYRF